MKFPAAILVLFTSLAVVSASNLHAGLSPVARHSRLTQRASSLEVAVKRAPKLCINRTNKKKVVVSSTKAQSSSSAAPKPTVLAAIVKPASSPAPNNGGSNSGGTIQVQSGNCGNSGATRTTTKTSGPNGSIDWLNCGINAGGWNPPFIRIENVITQSLSSALSSGSSPFKACAPYVWIFEKYGGQFNIPPIILASFAMQESSCNPATVGGGGEQGLMQITREKCGGLSDQACRDPEFNIRTGAKFFADTLNGNGGNLLLSIGQYNGWFRGMTMDKATAAAFSACCRCQNNLDYLHQFLNGWCQNINAYNNNFRLGKFFNLDRCG